MFIREFFRFSAKPSLSYASTYQRQLSLPSLRGRLSAKAEE